MKDNNYSESGYSILASVYDRLNDTVNYSDWADYIEKSFEKFSGKKISSVLELGCGTGSMTLELASRGYDMTAIDISEEMLSEAEHRARKAGIGDILFIESDMCAFELYGSVDAVICCLDGINHLLSRDEVLSCFSLVSNYLEPDGLFVFDVNTPHKFKTVFADRDYVLEDEGVMCCLRNRLNKKGDVADFYFTVFEESENGWTRRDGYEREKAYGLKSISNALGECGMQIVNISADYSFNNIDDGTDRWYITAKKS